MMIPRFVLTLAALSTLAVAQVQLQFGTLGASWSTGATYRLVLQLPNGDQLVIGTTQASSTSGLYNPPLLHSRIALATLGAAPFRDQPPDVTPQLGGSGNDVPQATAVDAKGNVWIVGETDSDDFNLVNPVVARKVPYRTAGFVIELDPTGNNLLFASYLAGQQPSSLPYFATYATALAIDSAGNVYVGGRTDETDFPTTPGAFLSGRGGTDIFGNTYFYSFLVQITPAGKLAYSTLLGTGASDCSGGSRCVAEESTSAGVSSLAVNAAGAVTVAGTLGGAYNPGTGYVTQVAADGSKTLWTTQVPNYAGVTSLFMAQDSSGAIDVFGQYRTLVVTDPFLPPNFGTPGLFAAQLRADGSGPVFLTDLGQSTDASAAGIVLDSSGNAWLAGTSSSAQFPALAGVPNLGADFVLRLGPAGAQAQTLFRLPHGAIIAPPAFDASGNLLLLGSQAAVLTLPPAYAFDTPAIVGFANSASYALNTGLYAGALVTIYGFDLANSAQGLQVLIDGTPAPVLFAGPNQINVQAPFELAQSYGVPQVAVTWPSGDVSLPLPRAQSIGFFTADGFHASALNQDGTVNSPSNPAAAGTVVSLFGTGAQWPSGLQDGAAAAGAMPLDQESNKFEMVDGPGTPLTILYEGAAPGLIDGVFQINVLLPANVNPPLTLHATTAAGVALSSNTVQLYMK